MRLLVTGFGPFPRMPRNPSAALARAVATSPRWHRLGVEATCRVLTTSYDALRSELDPVRAEGHDAVLMIGVAGRADRVRVERRATSRRSTLFPDAAGAVASPSEFARGREPEARATRVSGAAALCLLRQASVRSRLSADAGRYLCNASYFRALERDRPTLFIHIPVPRPGWRPRGVAPRRTNDAERLRNGLVAIGLLMLRQARRERR